MKLGLLIAVCALMLASVTSVSAEMRELYRIRVVNADGGPVEVSADGGLTYSTVGKVIRGTTSTMRGYAASVYAVPGTVCATAVHGIRIKVGGVRNCPRQESEVISIIPREFAVIPKGFGGHIAGDSGIYTDIAAGTSIFRNLSPFVGNPVFRETSAGLLPVMSGYMPCRGDVLVIVVGVPQRYPCEILIENRRGGDVQAVYPDGAKETIAKVERPVYGIGRFDATGYTGPGRINTSHTGVLTVSTAPLAGGERDGSGIETRGGFEIEPSRHVKSMDSGAQVMVVKPSSPGKPYLEGLPPLFSGYLGLAWYPGKDENSFEVRVRTTVSGSQWIDLPPMVGKNDSALMHLPGGKGAVTDIQIKFPRLTAGLAENELLVCSAKYEENRRIEAVNDGTLVKSGVFTVEMNSSKISSVQFVSLYLDGIFRGVSNTPPYSFSLDARNLVEGEHSAALNAVDSRGVTIGRTVRNFFVQKSGRNGS